MRLPITKIRRAVGHSGPIEVTVWDGGHNGSANMLLAGPDADLVDSVDLEKGTAEVEDDGTGLVKVELRLLNRKWEKWKYREIFVWQGEVYLELPAHLANPLARAVANCTARMKKVNHD
jgi:hypothetical protein